MTPWSADGSSLSVASTKRVVAKRNALCTTAYTRMSAWDFEEPSAVFAIIPRFRSSRLPHCTLLRQICQNLSLVDHGAHAAPEKENGAGAAVDEGVVGDDGAGAAGL